MPAGFQAFDASGNTILDTSDRVGRFLGVVTGVTGAGSITRTEFSQGTPFATFTTESVTDYLFTAVFSPNFSVSGNTLSWAFGQTPSLSNAVITIYYGVY